MMPLIEGWKQRLSKKRGNGIKVKLQGLLTQFCKAHLQSGTFNRYYLRKARYSPLSNALKKLPAFGSTAPRWLEKPAKTTTESMIGNNCDLQPHVQVLF